MGKLRAGIVRVLRAVAGAVACLGVLSIGPADAQSVRLLETFGDHCNDALFNSDGGGISSCIDLAALFDGGYYVAIGSFQSGPEAKNSAKFNADPLTDRGKLVLRVGKYLSSGPFEFALTARAGAQGGVVDDVTHDVRDALHGIFGRGTRAQRGDHDLRAIIGGSGHGWSRLELGNASGIKTALTPYVHGSIGTDNIEAGTGLLLSFQPEDADRPLPFMVPENGAYAPFFGGDGLGLFVAVRGVAHESFYDDLEKPAVAEAGLITQATFFGFVRPAFMGSCTTKPYKGALDPDCKMVFRLGFQY